jgi:AcrR family transcriptional regulator
MSRPPRAQRKELLTKTRQKLLDAAAVEFMREGYVGANINRISTAAGFAKGTIYNYFPSKRELMLALIDEIGTAHVDYILEQVEPEDEPSQRLVRFFSAGFAFVEQHPTQTPVIINAVYGPDPEFKQQVYQVYDRLFALIIQDIIRAGIARGEFRPMDPDITAALVMTIYLGGCSLYKPNGTILLNPDQVVSFILEGIRRQESSVPSEDYDATKAANQGWI